MNRKREILKLLKDYVSNCEYIEKLKKEMDKIDVSFFSDQMQANGRWQEVRQQLDRAVAEKKKVDNFYFKCSSRMQRIIRYKFFQGHTWEETASLMKATSSDSIRMELKRYIASL